ncbi:MAG: glycoside hydrolase family 95 protein [Rhizomicrobium sp.]|nr:glycoside hydrolase family 95 protein [Rhizomicrobium sp.]
MRSLFVVLCLSMFVAASCDASPPANTTLWYDKPAADWEHEGLPIGNGALGAMITGGVATDTIQFNEKSLWTGGPGSPGYDMGLPAESQQAKVAKVQALLNAKVKASPEEVAAILGHPITGYGDYQSFGELKLRFTEAPVTAYRRALDIGQALSSVAYEAGGVAYRRDYFASYPGGVIVVRLSANRRGKIAFTASLNAPDNRSVTVSARDGRITESGALKDNGLRYEAQVQVVVKGGTRRDNNDGSVTVSGADSAVLILAAATNYAPHYPDYRGDNPHRALTTKLRTAAGQGYAKLFAAHERDYRALFDRVALNLGGVLPNQPMNAVVAAYGKTDAAADRALEALYFQYGRYLLLASSRQGSLPANLQGVWNPSATPPWNDDYHVNINLQMNYWLADSTNLSEAGAPFYDFVDSLVPPGHVSAERFFRSKGWTVFLNTNTWGFTGVIAWPTAFWQPEAGAWLASQYFDHYRFSQDKVFLKTRAYPVMKGAAQLWLDALVSDPRDGTLVVSPSYSPEHGPFSAGGAMAQQIVYGLFGDTAEAARLVGDNNFADKLDTAREKLDPGLRIGHFGQLMEWKEDWDDPKDEHRHTSHLYALHPGHQISPLTTPQWSAAAKITLAARGDSTTSHGEAGTGWSKAWKANFWARLYDGDHAHLLLAQLLKENAMANLWDAYVGPPFQIDGNFGFTAAVAEMLVQSQNGFVDILPALPKAWADGSVQGLKARGDITVDLTWKNGSLQTARLCAGHDGPIQLRSPLLARAFTLVDLATQKPVAVTGTGERRNFEAKREGRYELRLQP